MKKEHIKHVFKTNKEAKELFQTSDGQVFFKKTDADAHGRTLKNKDITTFKRGQIEAEEAAEETIDLTPVNDLAPPAEPKKVEVTEAAPVDEKATEEKEAAPEVKEEATKKETKPKNTGK